MTRSPTCERTISLLYLSLHRLETRSNSQTNLSTTRTRQRTTRFTVPALPRRLESLPLPHQTSPSPLSTRSVTKQSSLYGDSRLLSSKQVLYRRLSSKSQVCFFRHLKFHFHVPTSFELTRRYCDRSSTISSLSSPLPSTLPSLRQCLSPHFPPNFFAKSSFQQFLRRTR